MVMKKNNFEHIDNNADENPENSNLDRSIEEGFQQITEDLLLLKEDDSFIIRDTSNLGIEWICFISGDKMKLSCSRTYGKTTGSVQSFVKIIKSFGIIKGLDYDLIEDIVNDINAKSEVEIVKGLPSKSGSDGCLTFNEVFDENIFNIDTGGKVDFKQIGFIKYVKKNDVLLKITPPTLGQDGFNIFGEIIKAEDGEEIIVKPGENVVEKYVGKEGVELRAMMNGQAGYSDSILSVSPVIVIDGDIDFGVGNLEFEGNIVIKGNILDRFEVNCDSDLSVGKNIRQAIVKCKRNVTVNGGIISKNMGEVNCSGNLVARYIDSGKVFAMQKIIVQKEVMHSMVYTNDKLICTQGAGKIIGGTIFALNGLECNILGSEYGIHTQLHIGENFMLRKLSELAKPKVSELKSELVKIGQLKKRITGINPDISNLDQKSIQDLDVLEHKEVNYKLELLALLRKMKECKESFQPNPNAKVVVLDTLYPPVTVRYGKYSTKIKDAQKNIVITFCNEEKKIVVKSL